MYFRNKTDEVKKNRKEQKNDSTLKVENFAGTKFRGLNAMFQL